MIKRFCFSANLERGKEEKNKNTVYGFGLRWDEIIDLYWFRETFEKGAFPEETRTETKSLIAHQPGIPLANVRAETMEVSESKEGLEFAATLSENSHRANDVLDAIERGDLTDVSIGFSLEGGKWRWEIDDREEDGLDEDEEKESDLLVVERVGLLREISFVDMGAYSSAKIQGIRGRYALEGISLSDRISYRCKPNDSDESYMLWRARKEKSEIDKHVEHENKLNARLKDILEGI